MKNKKLIVGLAVVAAVLIAVFSAIMIIAKPKTNEGAKNIEVTVVFKDETSKEFKISTDAEYLADALFEEELVTEAEYMAGYYTEINGVKADFSADQSWWCVTKDGEMTSVGMNEQVIADGDEFEITYTIG